MRRTTGERGQITLLMIGLAVVLVMLVGVVVNVSHVFLERRALASWADGAVTTATQQVAYDGIYGDRELDHLPISEAAARDAVVAYAAANGLGERFAGFRVAGVAVDAGRVTVSFAATVPLVGIGGVAPPVALTAEASATVPLS